MTSIAPNDANIVYSPYTWDVNATRALTINAGAYFRFRVTGGVTVVTLNFDVASLSSPRPALIIRVDGAMTSSFAEAAVDTVVGTVIPSTNAWASHVVEVWVRATTETANRWSASATAVKFTGLTLTGGTPTMAPARSLGLNVLCYGDSITEGVRSRTSGGSDDVGRNDGWQVWSAQLRSCLGAEVGVVGFGGQGVSVAGSGSVPALPSSYALLYSGVSRSFSPAPDAICILMGENDSTTNITAGYITVLNGLLAATPATTVILAMRALSGRAATYVQAAVAGCSDPSRATYVDTTGWFNTADSSDLTHPYGYTHMERLAPLAAAAVRSAWASRGPLFSRSSGGSALALTPFRG